MKPTAAPAYFPYAHRNMAEVMAAEVADGRIAAAAVSRQESLGRPCPKCGSPANVICKTPDGGPLYAMLHVARRRA